MKLLGGFEDLHLLSMAALIEKSKAALIFSMDVKARGRFDGSVSVATVVLLMSCGGGDGVVSPHGKFAYT